MINKSFVYLFPLIYYYIIEEQQLSFNYFKQNIDENIENTYIYRNNERKFIIKLINSQKTLIFLDIIKNSLIFEEFLQIDNSIIIVLKIPKSYEKSFSLFEEGKYSKIKIQHKELIAEFAYYNLPKMYDSIASILHKEKRLKESIMHQLGLLEFDDSWEMTSIILKQDETFIYD